MYSVLPVSNLRGLENQVGGEAGRKEALVQLLLQYCDHQAGMAGVAERQLHSLPHTHCWLWRHGVDHCSGTATPTAAVHGRGFVRFQLLLLGF